MHAFQGDLGESGKCYLPNQSKGQRSQNTPKRRALPRILKPGVLVSSELRGARFIEGPRLGQSLECTRGEPCRLAVQGEALQHLGGVATMMELLIRLTLGVSSPLQPSRGHRH